MAEEKWVKPTGPMSCEDFFEVFEVDFNLDQWFDEMLRSDSYSSEKLFTRLKELAAKECIALTDADTWNYDKYFWNVWKCTQKGLS